MIEQDVVDHEYLRGDGILGLLGLRVGLKHLQNLICSKHTFKLIFPQTCYFSRYKLWMSCHIIEGHLAT